MKAGPEFPGRGNSNRNNPMGRRHAQLAIIGLGMAIGFTLTGILWTVIKNTHEWMVPAIPILSAPMWLPAAWMGTRKIGQYLREKGGKIRRPDPRNFPDGKETPAPKNKE